MSTYMGICPKCGHPFVQGEGNYNYETALIDYECPECGWEGNENSIGIVDYDVEVQRDYAVKEATIVLSDVGDYSVFIKGNFPDWVDIVGISRKGGHKWYESKEILKSSEGIVAYFDEEVGKIFKKNCIYPLKLFRKIELFDLFSDEMWKNVPDLSTIYLKK